MTADEREIKRLKANLKQLTDAVMLYIRRMDDLSGQPSTAEVGRQKAALINGLEMDNDRARYNGLGVDFRTDRKADGPVIVKRDSTA